MHPIALRASSDIWLAVMSSFVLTVSSVSLETTVALLTLISSVRLSISISDRFAASLSSVILAAV